VDPTYHKKQRNMHERFMFEEESHYYVHVLADEFCEIHDNQIYLVEE